MLNAGCISDFFAPVKFCHCLMRYFVYVIQTRLTIFDILHVFACFFPVRLSLHSKYFEATVYILISSNAMLYTRCINDLENR